MINIVDISELQRLSDKIREGNERRHGIVITVANDMWASLHPIIGYLNLLLLDPQGFGSDDDTKKILERCRDSVGRERQKINKMIKFSVLENGKLQMSTLTFSLKPLVQSILDTIGYHAKVDVTGDFPDSVTLAANRKRVCNVIETLLSNAVIYSKPPQKIHVFYSSENEGTQHHIFV